jgi:hypothetical protein
MKKKPIIGLVIGIVVGIIIYLIPIQGLSSGGHISLALTLMTVLFWAFQIAQPAYVSVVFLALIIISGVVQAPNAATLAGPALVTANATATAGVAFRSWTGQNLWLIIGAYLIAAAVQTSGLGQRIAYNYMLRFVKNFKSVIIGIFVLTFILSLLIPHPWPRALMIMSVMAVIIKSSNIPKEDGIKYKATYPGFDIRKLIPAPTNTPEDAGPYITMGMCYAQDPENDDKDITIHRLCLQIKDEISMFFTPGARHLDVFRAKAEKAGKPLPVSINIGVDPAMEIAACFEPPITPLGFCELSIAGAIRGEAVEMTKCLTIDTLCIANSEYVIEGELLPNVRIKEDINTGTGKAMPEFPKKKVSVDIVIIRDISGSTFKFEWEYAEGLIEILAAKQGLTKVLISRLKWRPFFPYPAAVPVYCLPSGF